MKPTCSAICPGRVEERGRYAYAPNERKYQRSMQRGIPRKERHDDAAPPTSSTGRRCAAPGARRRSARRVTFRLVGNFFTRDACLDEPTTRMNDGRVSLSARRRRTDRVVCPWTHSSFFPADVDSLPLTEISIETDEPRKLKHRVVTFFSILFAGSITGESPVDARPRIEEVIRADPSKACLKKSARIVCGTAPRRRTWTRRTRAGLRLAQFSAAITAKHHRVEDSGYLGVLVDEHQRVQHVVIAEMHHGGAHPSTELALHRASTWWILSPRRGLRGSDPGGVGQLIPPPRSKSGDTTA